MPSRFGKSRRVGVFVAFGAGLALVLMACGVAEERPETGTALQPVIYGDDDRLDVYAHPDEFWREVAVSSAVAFFQPRSLNVSNPEDVQLRGQTLARNMGVCADEPFAEQIAAAYCSGVLIADDLVLTAGHCVPDPFDCTGIRMAFGYYMEGPGQLARMTADDVHSCAETMAWREEANGLDFAILRLDRPASAQRTPMPIFPEDRHLAPGTPIGMIGFPSGLPAKIDLGGQVTTNDGRVRWFTGSVDAFGGNSGSGVYDMEGRVVGLLARGARDYVNQGGCLRSNVLPELGPGQDAEGIVHASRAIESMCAEHEHELCGAVALDPDLDATADAGEWGSGGFWDDLFGGGGGDDDALCSVSRGGTGTWWLVLPGLVLLGWRRRAAAGAGPA